MAVGTGYQGGTLQTTWGTPVNNTRATGQVNVADSTSNDFYLTGVQMEASSYCSEFEHRSFGDELLRCYRYYYRLKGEDNKTYMIGMSDNDNVNIYGFFHFPVEMRTAPTALEQSGDASHYKVRRDTTQTCTAVPAFIDAMDFYCRVNFPRSSHGWGTGQMLWCQGGSSSSYLGFDAEM